MRIRDDSTDVTNHQPSFQIPPTQKLSVVTQMNAKQQVFKTDVKRNGRMLSNDIGGTYSGSHGQYLSNQRSRKTNFKDNSFYQNVGR